LDVERRFALAFTKEYQAIAEYNNTLARLDFARGTIMQRHNVGITQNGLALCAHVRPGVPEPERANVPVSGKSPPAEDRVHVVTAHFDAYCERLTRLANPDHMLLEGDVRLSCNRNGQTIRIEGQRVLVRVNDGTFTVESLPKLRAAQSQR
jgi:hypothetical protein